MTRRQLREKTFLLLFRNEFYEPEEMEKQLTLFLDDENKLSEEEIGELKNHISVILENVEKIDDMLKEKMTGWNIERVGKVELTILRLAVYEICLDDEVPNGVAINEAVELSKKYGQETSASFVNGVLAKFADK